MKYRKKTQLVKKGKSKKGNKVYIYSINDKNQWDVFHRMYIQ